MDMEAALLHTIVTSPWDAGRWMTLAAWLEKHDDPRRAELLRLQQSLLATCCQPDEHPERQGQQTRLVQLLLEGVRPCGPRQTLTLARDVHMTFVWVPPGSFLMGSPESEAQRNADETQHQVTLTRGFWLAVTPTTQTQWAAVMGKNASHFRGPDLPVEMVSWEDCRDFCELLVKELRVSCRLPSEAEWEYACRCGTTTPFFFGPTLSTEQANYDGSFPYGMGAKGVYRKQTTPVASLPCNAWGLFDMHGNVWEWCADWYGKQRKRAVRDPRGPGRGTLRVVRGGSWGRDAKDCRAAAREGRSPDYRIGYIGFRVAF